MSEDSLFPVLKRTPPARTHLRRRCPLQDGAVFSNGSKKDFNLCATVREFHPAVLPDGETADFPKPTDW